MRIPRRHRRLGPRHRRLLVVHLRLARNHPVGQDIRDLHARRDGLHSHRTRVGVDGAELRGPDEEIADEREAARGIDDGRLVSRAIDETVCPPALLANDTAVEPLIIEPRGVRFHGETLDAAKGSVLVL